MEVRILDQHERNATMFFGVHHAREESECCGARMLLTMPKKRSHLNAVQITTKQHKRRRGQTEAYHKKVQKRWDKRAKTDPRFQVTSTPMTLVLDTALLKFAEPYGLRSESEICQVG